MGTHAGVSQGGVEATQLGLKQRVPGSHSTCPHPAAESGFKGKKGSRQASANLSPGGPGGQIGNPIHGVFFPCPLCIIRTANRIHAAATVVSY